MKMSSGYGDLGHSIRCCKSSKSSRKEFRTSIGPSDASYYDLSSSPHMHSSLKLSYVYYGIGNFSQGTSHLSYSFPAPSLTFMATPSLLPSRGNPTSISSGTPSPHDSFTPPIRLAT